MAAETQRGRCRIRQQPGIDWEFEEAQFDASYWRDGEGFQSTLGGRGGSCLIEIDGRKAVLRRYRRGGVMGNLFSDQYLWLGQARSRPWLEWDVLLKARAAGLPVPEPIAACTCRTGFWYRAALITAFLDDTQMMTERLQQQKLDAQDWRRLGSLIRDMHDAGIRHADLTTDNILLDSAGRFYLVDFDKARVMRQPGDWQWAPLERLQRSIIKRQGQQALHFDSADWQELLDGYRGG